MCHASKERVLLFGTDQRVRRNHQTGEVSLDPLRWGLIPYWCNDPKGGRKPINAKCETVRDLPTFRDAYRKRRCIVPVDGFFEWKAIKGQKAKQPYAIAMKDGAPFGIAGVWENWKEPASGEWIRTFAIITTDSKMSWSLISISYAVFCLKKKKNKTYDT